MKISSDAFGNPVRASRGGEVQRTPPYGASILMRHSLGVMSVFRRAEPGWRCAVIIHRSSDKGDE